MSYSPWCCKKSDITEHTYTHENNTLASFLIKSFISRSRTVLNTEFKGSVCL